jgi:hypothetical protein
MTSVNDLAYLPALSPFVLADGSALAKQQTTTRLAYTDDALYVHFTAQDNDIWGSYSKRDEPIFNQEVVEVFIAPGETAPIDYFEFELSPNGVLLDARVHNPTSQRVDLRVDLAWNADLDYRVQRHDEAGYWTAQFVIPWTAMITGMVPRSWRANFYRIERPRKTEAEFSCWSATMTSPADFHKPAYFGYLTLG